MIFNSKELTGQAKWTATHKANNPEGEARRKEKERQTYNLHRFHARRNILFNIPVPNSIDTESEPYKGIAIEYLKSLINQP